MLDFNHLNQGLLYYCHSFVCNLTHFSVSYSRCSDLIKQNLYLFYSCSISDLENPLDRAVELR